MAIIPGVQEARITYRGEIMNRKICNIIFFLMCFSLIFDDIPKAIQLNFLGGPVGNKLIVYPLLIGVIYTAYCYYRHNFILPNIRQFSNYILAFIIIMILSTIHGLFIYPYYDLVLNGPINQIEKLPKVLNLLAAHGIYVDSRLLMQAWVIIRQLKGIIMEAFWCFGGAYMVYCWYRKDWHQAINVMMLGISASFIVLFLYALIEIPYLAGNSMATNILKSINPYIHAIVTNHGWWPPLLWKGQLRLVFAEPSHVGNFIAIGLPIIWYMYFSQRGWQKYFALTISFAMSFLVFMTKARTAWGMMAGMFALLLCLILWGKQFGLLKKCSILAICIGIGFFGFIQFEQYTSAGAMATKEDVAVQALESNLTSLASSNKRSNGARYALLKAHFRTGVEHPLLGVGKGLTSAYVHDHFTYEESKNREVADWIRYQDERGPMASGYSIPDAMNEFVSRFSSTGVLGLLIFFYPFAYTTLRLLIKWRRENKLITMFIALALISSIMAGCNGSVNILYAVYLLLGIGYAMILGEEGKRL